jgi:hypothetical protein
MRDPEEVLLVNHARIGPLAGMVRTADGLSISWDGHGRGVVIADERRDASWLIPWANIASVKLARPEVAEGRPAAAPVFRRRAAKEAPDTSGPCDKRTLAPIIGAGR